MKESTGFTLIELIAVIALIGLISILVIPAITNLLNKNKAELDKTTIRLIELAADNYLDANESTYYKTNGSIYCVKIDDLINSGFLEEGLIDIKTGNNIDREIIIKSTYNSHKYTYELLKANANCVATKNNKLNQSLKIETFEYNYPQISLSVNTNDITNGEKITLKIRKGNTVKGAEKTETIQNNQASFNFEIELETGEYVIEASYKSLKDTKNLTVTGSLEE